MNSGISLVLDQNHKGLLLIIVFILLIVLWHLQIENFLLSIFYYRYSLFVCVDTFIINMSYKSP